MDNQEQGGKSKETPKAEEEKPYSIDDLPQPVQEQLNGLTEILKKLEEENFNLGAIARKDYYKEEGQNDEKYNEMLEYDEKNKIDEQIAANNLKIDAHDAENLEKAGFFRRIFRAGTVKKDGEYYNAKKLKEEISKKPQEIIGKEKVRGKQEVKDPVERLQYAAATGVDPQDKDFENIRFSKAYKPEGKLTKTVERDKTESEKIREAEAIVKGKLDQLKKGDGQKLIDNQTGLDIYKKEVEELGKTFSNEDEKQKFFADRAVEAKEREDLIKEDRNKLNMELKKYVDPLVAQSAELGSPEDPESLIGGLTEAKKMAELGEKTYRQKKDEIQSRVNKVRSMKEINKDGKLDETIKEWEAQLEEAKFTLKQFEDRKKEINARLNTFKNDKKNIENQLNEISRIGKTDKEFKEEEKRKKEGQAKVKEGKENSTEKENDEETDAEETVDEQKNEDDSSEFEGVDTKGILEHENEEVQRKKSGEKDGKKPNNKKTAENKTASSTSDEKPDTGKEENEKAVLSAKICFDKIIGNDEIRRTIIRNKHINIDGLSDYLRAAYKEMNGQKINFDDVMSESEAVNFIANILFKEGVSQSNTKAKKKANELIKNIKRPRKNK